MLQLARDIYVPLHDPCLRGGQNQKAVHNYPAAVLVLLHTAQHGRYCRFEEGGDCGQRKGTPTHLLGVAMHPCSGFGPHFFLSSNRHTLANTRAKTNGYGTEHNTAHATEVLTAKAAERYLRQPLLTANLSSDVQNPTRTSTNSKR
jgi:hypothetical protein